MGLGGTDTASLSRLGFMPSTTMSSGLFTKEKYSTLAAFHCFPFVLLFQESFPIDQLTAERGEKLENQSKMVGEKERAKANKFSLTMS